MKTYLLREPKTVEPQSKRRAPRTRPATVTEGLVIVVEACTNLTNPIWFPVGTNTLTDGSSYFSDPQWTNNPGRFYRLRSP